MSLSELLTNSLEAGDTKYLRKLNQSILLDSEKSAIKWILEYEDKYKSPPSLKRLKDDGTHSPYISKTLSGSPLKDLFDRATSKFIARYALNAHTEMEEILHSSGTFPIEEYLKIGKLLTSISTDESVSALTIDRDKMYSGEDLAEGVETGISYIDDTTGGVMGSEVLVYVARTGVGKTLILCTQAVRLARQGKRVLIMSLEMLPRQLLHRIDATFGKFNPRIFRSRKTEDIEERELKREIVEKELEIVKRRGGDIVFTERHVKTVDGLRRAIEEVKPDVVMIDGIYLMELEGRQGQGASWEKVKTISNSLKQLALDVQIPFIETSQFNRTNTKSAERRQDLEEMGFTDAIAQDADMVVGFYKDDDERKVIGRLLKVRNGEMGGEFTLELDWSVMEVREVVHTPTTVVLGGGKGAKPYHTAGSFIS